MNDTEDIGNDKKRKRPRAARACDLCRSKKYKCDENEPCTQCRKQKVPCKYQGAERIRDMMNMSSYVAELESRVQQLSAEVARRSSSVVSGQPSPPAAALAYASPGPTESTRSQRTRISPPKPTDHRDTSNDSGDEEDTEINDVNAHTRNTEFHGPTSSMAFLSAIQPQKSSPGYSRHSAQSLGGVPKQSIVSDFHNNAFSPSGLDGSGNPEFMALEAERYHFRQAHLFLDGYFKNLHFVHPILDRTQFLARCEDLWFGRSERQPRSFVALYYSVMAIGALVREWDQQVLDGLGRFQWSRKLFRHADQIVENLRFCNDIEIVQCLIFLAKVCQNELNPHMAYMYLGKASRVSLGAGHNRQSRKKFSDKDEADVSNNLSKVWWGLYSLEIEMSFSLGRPDSLGLDDYHNRSIPPVDGSETDVIVVMVDFARIIRKVSVFIYLSGSSVRDQTAKAFQLEEKLDQWVAGLPEKLRPRRDKSQNPLEIMKDPEWARRLRLVLELRYLNVNMILFRPFLICASRTTRQGTPALDAAVTKCVNAARRSIELMHDTFCKHAYFRTWWYNTTYVLYAASIILCRAERATTTSTAEKEELLHLIDMTLEVLEVMEESVVAKTAAEMVRQILYKVRHGEALHKVNNEAFAPGTPGNNSISGFDYDGLHIQMPDLSMDPDLDFINASLPLDYGQLQMWSNFQDSAGDFHL